ncbi:MAG: PilZ domain-containing protein [Desulfobulbaceae bacterium]|nr:PilZ domain-containing protein [Desulfobulbaceae bacterium]
MRIPIVKGLAAMSSRALPENGNDWGQDAVERKTAATERRRQPRFSAHERALVAVSGDDFGLPYHLLDISEGGMAFRYLNQNPLPLTDSQMDIYLDANLQVGRLPVTVVDDMQLAGGFIAKRRCCVRFGKLTQAQQLQLQAFIRRHSKAVSS